MGTTRVRLLFPRLTASGLAPSTSVLGSSALNRPLSQSPHWGAPCSRPLRGRAQPPRPLVTAPLTPTAFWTEPKVFQMIQSHDYLPTNDLCNIAPQLPATHHTCLHTCPHMLAHTCTPQGSSSTKLLPGLVLIQHPSLLRNLCPHQPVLYNLLGKGTGPNKR